MFALFSNDNLVNFWGNKVGDVFIVNTCQALSLDPSMVDLIFYPLLTNSPEHYEFDQNKNLTVKNKVITYTTENQVDVNGDPVLDGQGNQMTYQQENVSYEVASIHTADPFFAKGITVKMC